MQLGHHVPSGDHQEAGTVSHKSSRQEAKDLAAANGARLMGGLAEGEARAAASKRTAEEKAMGDPARRAQFRAVLHHLLKGRPMSDLLKEEDY